MKKQTLGVFLLGMFTTLILVLLVGGFIVMTNQILKLFVDEPVMSNSEKTVIDAQEETDDPPDADAIGLKIQEILDVIEANYYEDYETEDLVTGMYQGLVAALGDPYSSYMTKAMYEDRMLDTSGVYEGIGVVVSYSKDGEDIVVVAPYKDSPGYLAGIRPNDVIVAVDGTNVVGMLLDDAVRMIRGDKGTEVILSIYRPSEETTMDLKITRDEISAETVEYEMLEGQMGYIRVTGFQGVTKQQFSDALEALNLQGQEGLIIDLRNNPGGLLNAVVEMTELLIGKELIVYVEDKHGNRMDLEGRNNAIYDKPLVILINQASASASEILSGAVKDYDRGVLVGETTFGKGLVQDIIGLNDGSAVYITFARYFTPSGAYIHDVGVSPDVAIYLEDDLPYLFDTDRSQDIQLNVAIETLLEIME